MHRSDSITALATALAKAQAEIKSIAKDRTNPHYKNRYATLDAILDGVRPVLAKHGLSIVQGASDAADGFAVETYLLHASGEWVSTVLTMPVAKQDAQGVGSALTYGRRYGVSALLALSTDDDDDGEQAAANKPASKPATKPKAQADDPKREWDGTDADALGFRFPVVGSPNHGKPMGEMSDADLQAFVAWAGVKPDYLNVRTRADAILTYRQSKGTR